MKHWLFIVVGVWLFQGCGGTELPKYQLTVTTGSGGTVSPSGAITVKKNAATTINAAPNSNYNFVNWTVVSGTGVTIANENNATTSVTLTESDATIQANFGREIFTRIVKVYDGIINPVISGITVQVLDNDTGEPLPGADMLQTSDANGNVNFTLPAGTDVVAIRVIGGPQIGTPATDYVDAVLWNQRATDQDRTAYLIKWIDIYLASFWVTGDNANHAADGGQKAVFNSRVLYTGPNGPTDTGSIWQPVGCATVKYFDSNDTEEIGVHFQYYSAAGLPASGKVQSPAANGGFSSFTITPGRTTVKAYEYGTGIELTSSSLPNVIGNMLKSDDDSADLLIPSTRTYPTGAHPVINIANIYIKASATNPEAACTAQ